MAHRNDPNHALLSYALTARKFSRFAKNGWGLSVTHAVAVSNATSNARQPDLF
jgi:hypothetical protein